MLKSKPAPRPAPSGAADAVNRRKQQHLLAAARLYLQRSPYADAAIRFDVVEVTPAAAGWQVHCIKDAFQDN